MIDLSRWRRILHLALTVSSAAFVLGLITDGFWGGTDGQTNWVDQSFGFAMYLGAALSIVLATLLLVGVLVSGASHVIWHRRTASDENAVVDATNRARDARNCLRRRT